MTINRVLLAWQLRRTLPATWFLLPVAILYVLFESERLQFRFNSVPGLFVTVHCLLIVWRTGRTSLPEFRYLYSQGYSRDSLFLHTMLASFITLLAMWIPIGLLVYLYIRAGVQFEAGNPWFPFSAWTERPFVWRWFLVSLTLLPPFHYAWVRASLARRGVLSGYALALAAYTTGAALWLSTSRVASHATYTSGSLALLAAAMTFLIGGMYVHRRIEVLG